MSQAKLKILAFTIAIAVTAGGYSLLPHAVEPPAPAPAPAPQAAPKVVEKAPAKPALPLALSLSTALRENRLRAEFIGNGKDKLTFVAHNAGAQPIRLQLPAGQLFASAKSTIALVRSEEVAIEPNAQKTFELMTVATSSTNAPDKDSFTISAARLPRLDALFAWLDEHPEVSLPAVQTATLALTENLPVSAFAKFTAPDSALSHLDTSAFKADTSDIIAALLLLREIGLDEQLALTIDPQLKIEAMIDPLAHALAVRYYGIADEWTYWKNELQHGDPATRHYALYGIARFYPDVALQMLPKWARTEQTPMVFRASAIQALAETQRSEALSILRQLENEIGSATDLGRAAHAAANYLDAQFTKAPVATVAFRASKNLTSQKPNLAAAN